MIGKTLIIQPLPGIGDMIWHLPVIRSIAAQAKDNKVSMLVKPSAQTHKLFGHEDILDDVINLKADEHVFKLTKTISKQNFDSVYIFHHSPKFSALAFMAGIPKRYGYGFGWQKLFLNAGQRLKQEDYPRHNIDKSKLFLSLNGFSDLDRLFYLSAHPEAIKKIRALNFPRPWFTFGIGATEQRRIWPAACFAELSNEIVKTHGGTVFLMGAGGEQPITDAIKADAKKCQAFMGQPLESSIALIAESDVFIGNDSGLMNIAATLNKPTIGIFPDHKVLSYVDNIVTISPEVTGIENVNVDMVMERLSMSLQAA